MSKKFIIVIIAFGVLMLVIFVVSKVRSNTEAGVAYSPLTPSPSETSVTAPAPVPSVTHIPGAPEGSTFILGTAHGSVTVNNFYAMPLVIDENLLILKMTNDYEITYDTMNNQFFIYASSSPFSSARTAGESAFISLLGISESDACKLNVLEGYPVGVSSAGLGTNLSFCSSGFSTY